MRIGLVSIITPCYNGERYLSETIESVRSQTYTSWEMLIVDDGSTDKTAEIACAYARRDNRIRLIQQKNAGSAAARNNGIRQAEGQYIALLDADDIWLPTFLERQIRFMHENDAICVACAYDHIDENSLPVLKPTPVKAVITVRDMRVLNCIGCLTGVYDTTKYGKIYLHEELKSLRDDYAYWYDIVSLATVAYGNSEVLASYRVLRNSVTGRKFRLIPQQYKFYRNFLKEGVCESIINICKWGISGIYKFM